MAELGLTQSNDDEEEGEKHSAAAIPGLPDDLAVLCIARVPAIASIWTVCRAWRRLVLSSLLFRGVREKVGLHNTQWLYVLLKTAAPAANRFEWHAYDPLAQAWHALPPLPLPDSLEFHLSSPSLIGHSYSIQCASSSTRLFMVAACRLADSANDHPPSQHPRLAPATAQPPPQHPAPFRTRRRLTIEPALPSPLTFNTSTNSWSFTPPLIDGPRCWCATGIDDSGKLYVASGSGRLWDVQVSRCAEVYDPEEGTWAAIQGLPSSKFSGEAITAVNYQGKLHMVSGRGVFRKAGVFYDSALGRWLDMPRGMRAGWAGSCLVLDNTLLSLDDSAGRLRFYQPSSDTWHIVLTHPMLKGLEQVIAAPGSRLCGLVRQPAGQANVIRVVHLSPTLADSAVAADRLVIRELSFVDISAPFPNATFVAMQLLASITQSPTLH